MPAISERKIDMHASWLEHLREEFEQDYMISLRAFLKKEMQAETIYPPAKEIFNAFNSCPFDEVKVVIVGQDPYHGPGQAHGLCFSVQHGIKAPPSLQNIFKELKRSLDFKIPEHGCLTSWAEQGVFLPNTCLTVRAHEANSHAGQGWENFTDKAIRLLAEKREGLVFMLWGSAARKKAAMIDKEKHLVLEAPHPSPLSAHRGFIGCDHFKKANEYLIAQGKKTINWELA